jgi:hypothetical protein
MGSVPHFHAFTSEEKTGRSVVTGENFLPPGRKKISDK